MAKNKLKFKRRHKITLKESLEFTKKKEAELLVRMDKKLKEVFPNWEERQKYIEDNINALDKLIEENKEI